MLSRIQRRSLRTKIIAWSFVPTAILLLAVALVAYFAYQQVTETLAIERDQQLTRLSASQLLSKLTPYADELTALARTADIRLGDASRQQNALVEARNRLVVFDGGVVLLDTFGTVRASEPARPELAGQDWSNRDYFRRMVSDPKPTFSNILNDGLDSTEVIAVAVPVIGDRGEFLGTLVGMFRLGPTAVSAFYGSIVKLRIGQSGNPYLVDGLGKVIYHWDNTNIGEDFSSQPVVQRVLGGETGAIRTRDLQDNDIVAGFSPVPGTDWSLVTEESWTTLSNAARTYRETLVLLLVMGIVIPTTVVAIGVRRITQPINEVIGAAREVARGNLGQTISVDTGDEIETLARQFNRMSAQLQESYAELEKQVADRTEALAALNAIAAVASRSQNLQDVLDRTLEKTLEVMRIETGGIYLLDENSYVLSLAAQQGIGSDGHGTLDTLHPESGFPGQVVQSDEAIVVSEVSLDPQLDHNGPIAQGFRTLAGVPLASSGKVLGALFVASRDPRRFSDQELELLTSIGHQMGVAVENARLLAQAQETATLRERQRLARELHDAVTQTLFSASLIAEVLPRLWQINPEEGWRRVEELRLLTRGALAEMRTLLMELRPSALTEAPLADIVRQLSEAFIGRTRVPVNVEVDGESRLPADAQVALYRIAQEALNNIAKHAGATQVTISLHCSPQGAYLSIRDDGAGFDPNETAPDRLGLAIMRERAEAIGANLTIDSQPGRGTMVEVAWSPISEARPAEAADSPIP